MLDVHVPRQQCSTRTSYRISIRIRSYQYFEEHTWEYIYTESRLKNEIKYIWWVWCSLRRMLLHISCTTEMERESNWGGDEGRRVNTNITFCTFVMDNYYPNYDLLIRECFWNNIFKLLVKSTYCFLFGLLYGITYFIMNREVSPLELSRKQVFNIRITAHYNRLQKNKLKWEYFYFGFVSSSCCIIKCWKVIEGNRRIFSTW